MTGADRAARAVGSALAAHQVLTVRGHELRAAVRATYGASYADQDNWEWREWWECALWAVQQPARQAEGIAQLLAALAGVHPGPSAAHPHRTGQAPTAVAPMTAAELVAHSRGGPGQVIVGGDV